MFWTDNHTGRLQSDLRAMGAIVALGGGMAVGVDVERVIGAGLHARFTTDAARGVEVYDAVLALIESFGGTDSHARSIIAVVAAVDEKIAASVGKLAFFDVFHPGSIHANGHIVFGLARDSTGVTADALALVNYESILRHESFPSVG